MLTAVVPSSVISDSHYQSSLGGLRPSQPPSTPTSFHPPQAYNQDLPGRDSRTGDIAQQQQQPRTTLTMDQLGSSDSSTEFLPSVGFDELHASLTAYDSDVNNFPPPGSRDGLNTISISTPADTNMRIPNNTGIAKEREQTGKISRSQSLVRRFSNAPGKGSQSSVTLDTSTMPPPSAPAAGKGRRQSTLSSTLPQAGATQASRPPRKSVGPGFLSQTTASRAASRESRVTPSHSTPSLIRTASITRPNRLAPGAAGATSTNEPTGSAARKLSKKRF
jgi:dual specificity tyrosine-phosphorylation-regulated kinase 2/3/4